MFTVSLVSLLCCCAIVGHAIVLNRAPQTSRLPAPYANSTTGSTISPTLSSSPSLCTACQWGEPDEAVSFNWPIVNVIELVLATIIYKVSPDNITSTITRYSNQTLSSYQYTLLDAAQWNSILSTTGVTVENETPYFKYVTTIYTAPNAPFTVSSTLTSPRGYTNWGWLYYTVNSSYGTLTSTGWRRTEVITGCVPNSEKVLFAITPTATPPGYTNPYEAPLPAREWSALVPSSIKGKCTTEAVVAPQVAIQSVSALTETSTEYEDGPPRTQIDPGDRETPSASVSLEPQVTATDPPATDIPPARSLPPLSQRPELQAPQDPSQGPPQVHPPTPTPPPPSQPQPQPQPPLSSPSSTSNIPIPIIIGTQTLIPGSPAITISGIPISILAAPNPNNPSNPNDLQLSVPLPSPSPAPPNPQSLPAPVVVIGTQTVTLVPNAPVVTIAGGTPISITSNPTATALIIDGTNTISITQLPASTPTSASRPISGDGGGGSTTGRVATVTLSNGPTLTLSSNSNGGEVLVIGTQKITLTPGGAGATVAGTEYSLAPAPSGGNFVVVDGVTVSGSAGEMSTEVSASGQGAAGTAMTSAVESVPVSMSASGGGEVFTGSASTPLSRGKGRMFGFSRYYYPLPVPPSLLFTFTTSILAALF